MQNLSVVEEAVKEMYRRGAKAKLIETTRCVLTCARRQVDMGNLRRLLLSSAIHGVLDHEPADSLRWRGIYFIIEGNHRVRVAQSLCQEFVMARVGELPDEMEIDANTIWLASVRIRVKQPARKRIPLIEQCINFKGMLPTIRNVVDQKLGLHQNGKQRELVQDVIGEALYGAEFFTEKNAQNGHEDFLFAPFASGAARVLAIRRVCMTRNGLDIMRKLKKHRKTQKIFTFRDNRYLGKKMFKTESILNCFLACLEDHLSIDWESVTLGHLALSTDPGDSEGRKTLDDIILVAKKTNDDIAEKVAVEWKCVCKKNNAPASTREARQLQLERYRQMMTSSPNPNIVMKRVKRAVEEELAGEPPRQLQVVSEEHIKVLSKEQEPAPRRPPLGTQKQPRHGPASGVQTNTAPRPRTRGWKRRFEVLLPPLPQPREKRQSVQNEHLEQVQRAADSLPRVPRRPPVSDLPIKRQPQSPEEVTEQPESSRAKLLEEQVHEMEKVYEVEKVGEGEKLYEVEDVDEVDDTRPRAHQSPEELIEQAQYSPQSSSAEDVEEEQPSEQMFQQTQYSPHSCAEDRKEEQSPEEVVEQAQSSRVEIIEKGQEDDGKLDEVFQLAQYSPQFSRAEYGKEERSPEEVVEQAQSSHAEIIEKEQEDDDKLGETRGRERTPSPPQSKPSSLACHLGKRDERQGNYDSNMRKLLTLQEESTRLAETIKLTLPDTYRENLPEFDAFITLITSAREILKPFINSMQPDHVG